MPGWVDGSGCRCLCECYSTFVTRYTMAANSRLTIYMLQDKKLRYILARRSRWGFWKWGHRALINHHHWPLTYPKAVVPPFLQRKSSFTLTWYLDNLVRTYGDRSTCSKSVCFVWIIKTKPLYSAQLEALIKMTNYSLFHVNKSQDAKSKQPWHMVSWIWQLTSECRKLYWHDVIRRWALWTW